MGTILSPSSSPHMQAPPRAAEAVRRCYDVLELCRGCGITDFTDGKYDVDSDSLSRRAYLAAQRRQAAYLLDQVDCDKGSRLLDVGCGYGRLLAAAGARRARAIGLTISPPQVEHCTSRGLDARLMNYRALFSSGDAERWERQFDGIIANGSLEHFVQCEEAAEGRADDIYSEFFEICHRLLRPGGRLATTAIHSRAVGQVHPADVADGPDRWPRGSVNYHAANLHRSFGGWLPEPGQLEHCADGRFRLEAAEDGTRDYLLTSQYWMRQIRRSLAFDPRSWPLALRTFTRQPRATWQMLRCLLWDQSWTFQFRPPAPAQLWRHTWVAV